MKRIKPSEVLKPALILFAICLIVTALLAGTNLLTQDAIAAQEQQKQDESCRVALPEAETFSTMEGVEGTSAAYEGQNASGDTVGWVFVTESKGYGGTMRVMTGINSEEKVTGVVILSHDETPGLGANAEKDSFRNQYQQNVPQDGFQVVKSEPSDGEIQAMTGATISSNAVTDAVNTALDCYRTLQSKGGAQ